MFVAFLKAYYEWLETNGQEVFSGKIISATHNTVVLPATASDKVNIYQGKNLVCLNGPTKGHTRKILEYHPDTKTAVIDPVWEANGVPLANTLIAIRDNINPGVLLEYKDIDLTLDRFIDYFRNEFMYQIPGNVLADKRNILKHIKDFYQARGTENSFRFLFRILFNEEVEFYYPKVDLFRASDARWYVENIMKITTTGDTFDYVNRKLIGVKSGATAKVESATQQHVAGGTITELKLSNIDGKFIVDEDTGLPEQVKIVYPVDAPPQSDLGAATDVLEPFDAIKWEQAYQLLEKLLISQPGQNYAVGETITISGGGELSEATAIITSVFETIYTGRCSPPPSVYYLEPFFGANDTVNTTGDPLQDGVCIPGLYFFSDVRSDYTIADLLNSTEIKLAQTETTVDDFFVGDEIALVSGTGVGQRRTIVSYNGTTKIAVVDEPFYPVPDGTTGYSITHVRGGIKSVKIIDFGLGFLTNPTATINTTSGSGAVLPPLLGLVGETAGQWTTGRDGGIGGAATTTDSFASANKIIQDSYYWQDFSYDLRVGQTVDKYRDIVKTLLHPAGMKMFGTVMLKTRLETNFPETIQRLILEIGTRFFDLDLDVHPETVIQTVTQETGTIEYRTVVGTKNKDVDGFKFRAFPPNVRFNLIYPFPNQDYWSPTGPGNTQINNFKDMVIGDLINFPERRTKINPDAYIVVNNADSLTRVGPVGQSRASLAYFRFKGFPPFEGFYNPFPPPNSDYWDGVLGGFGNTQLESFKDMVISEVIETPKHKHSNFCIDGTFNILRGGPIPKTGNLVEYSFVEGIDPQIVYNVGPNSYGDFNAVLGSDVNTEGSDPAFITEGLELSAGDSDIVNATGVPLDLKRCTVIVVAAANGLSDDMTLVSMLQNSSDNGFAIEFRQGGGFTFRARYDNVEKHVDFPVSTVANNDYFMAALRFDQGKLSGNVNTIEVLNSNITRSTTFLNYPNAPTTTSEGWYFGKPSIDLTPVSQPPALFRAAQFNQVGFSQNAITATPIPLGYFNGTLVYAIFYDRALYDYELDTIYKRLNLKLFNERGVNLDSATLFKTQLGKASIRKQTTRTQTGTANVKLTRTKTLDGISAIRNTTNRTLSGLGSIQNTTTRTQSGTSSLQNTAPLRTIVGGALIENTGSQTITGLSRLQVSGVEQTVDGTSRITGLTLHTQQGIGAVQNTTLNTIQGLGAVQNTTLRTQQGLGAVRDVDLPSVSEVATYFIKPTNANYTFVDDNQKITLAYTGSTSVGYPVGLYDTVNFGTNTNFTYEVGFTVTTMSSGVGIGFQDDSGGVGAITEWRLYTSGSNYRMSHNHWWTDTGWFNWNFYDATIGSTSSPPPGGVFYLRFRQHAGTLYLGWSLDGGSTWTEPTTTSGLPVISLFPFVIGTGAINIYSLKLHKEPYITGTSRIQVTTERTQSGTSTIS